MRLILIFDLAFLCWDVWFCVAAAAQRDIVRALFFYGLAALMLIFIFADQRMHQR